MKNIVIRGWMVALSIFVMMFGGIYLTMRTGDWSTSRTAQPVTLESGEYDPVDIRGSYTFAEIEKFFGIPTEVLFTAFAIPEDKRTDTFKVKDIHEIGFAPVNIGGEEIEVGTDLVRVFTALYSGRPYESAETTHLPVSAVNTLIEAQKLDEEQSAYWTSHSFELVLSPEGAETSQQESSNEPIQSQTPQAEAAKPEKSDEGVETETAPTVDIKGKTPLGDLLDAGLTQEQFKEIFGIDFPDDSSVTFKDFTDQHELDREAIKAKIADVLQR